MDPEKTSGIVDELARVEVTVERFGASVQRPFNKQLISEERAVHDADIESDHLATRS